MIEYNIKGRFIIHNGVPYIHSQDIGEVTIEVRLSEDAEPAPPPAPMEEPKRRGPKPKLEKPKGKKKCGNCGEYGHQARTCGREQEIEVAPVQPGRTGISEEQFDQVKEFQADGQNSMEISKETGIPLVQIGRIMNSDDYEEYLSKT